MKLSFSRFIVFFSLCSFFPWIGLAQSVTPSMDPTKSARLPAAVGWNEVAAVGFTYEESSGNRKLDNEETHTFDSSGISGNLIFLISNISLEIAGEQSSTTVKVDQPFDQRVNLDYTMGRANAALIGGEFVAVGLGGNSRVSNDYIDSDHQDEETTMSGIVGSISVKMFDVVYLGGGYERIKATSSYTVDNTWNTAIIGAALKFGELGGTRFRAEVSYESTPESTAEEQGLLEKAVHLETNQANYAAELMISGLLFALRGYEKQVVLDEKVEYNDKSFENITFTNSEGGVVWVPANGVALGFFFASNKTTYIYEEENTEFRVNIAYIFE